MLGENENKITERKPYFRKADIKQLMKELELIKLIPRSLLQARSEGIENSTSWFSNEGLQLIFVRLDLVF